MRANISDMAHPDLIRSARRHAFSCEHRPWPKGPLAASRQLFLTQKARYAILSTPQSFLPELARNPRATVTTFVLLIDTLDFFPQFSICLGSRRLLRSRPLIITTARNAQG